MRLDEQNQGLVHISEITHGFVKDINDHLKVGDEVNVKVLSIDEKAGKIGLSIRATEEAPEQVVADAKVKKQPRKRQAAPITHIRIRTRVQYIKRQATRMDRPIST